jgi:hypothetical protein
MIPAENRTWGFNHLPRKLRAIIGSDPVNQFAASLRQLFPVIRFEVVPLSVVLIIFVSVIVNDFLDNDSGHLLPSETTNLFFRKWTRLITPGLLFDRIP